MAKIIKAVVLCDHLDVGKLAYLVGYKFETVFVVCETCTKDLSDTEINHRIINWFNALPPGGAGPTTEAH